MNQQEEEENDQVSKLEEKLRNLEDQSKEREEDFQTKLNVSYSDAIQIIQSRYTYIIHAC